MRGIFYAMGPSFKRNHTNPWIKIVDEYQLMAHAMGTSPEKSHHGNWERVKGMLAGNSAGSLAAMSVLLHLLLSLILPWIK